MVTGYNNPDPNLKTLHYALERSWWFIFDPKDIGGQYSLNRLCHKDISRYSHLVEACAIYNSNDKFKCVQGFYGPSFEETKRYNTFLFEN